MQQLQHLVTEMSKRAVDVLTVLLRVDNNIKIGVGEEAASNALT